MQIFYRQNFTEIVLTLRSDSSLGLLDGGYIEDYFGIDNQLTLHNMDTNSRVALLLDEDTDVTPSIPHDAFSAVIDLSSTIDGLYRIEGRVRDTAGNYTILSDFSTPNGTEDLIMLELLISPLSVVLFSPKEASIVLVQTPEAELVLQDKPEATLILEHAGIEVSFLLKEEVKASVNLLPEIEASFVLPETPELQILDMYMV